MSIERVTMRDSQGGAVAARRFVIAGFLLATILTPAALAGTIYVNGQTGDDAWDGLCEEWDGGTCGPKATIQAGINAATNGDEVVVADGTYGGVRNRNLDFGGKAITVRSASGDPETCIIDCETAGRGFYFHSGETRTAVVDGLTITNGLVVEDNGGGICCIGSGPTIINCVLSVNDADPGSGGGIYSEGGSPLIKDCRFDDCYCYWISDFTPHGGGGVYCTGGTPEIIGNFFTGCYLSVSCTDGGGAIGFYETDIVIRGNEIRNCGGHGAGGGICGESSQVNITDNVIGQCGGFHYGGGLALWGSSGTVYQNLIVDNHVEDLRGGGVYIDGGSIEIALCTIANNAVGLPSEHGYGGGVCVYGAAEASIRNCILSGNIASYEGDQIYVDESATATVSYCNVQGGWPGEGNMDGDPLFVDPDNDDFHLSAASPCIDSGDPDFVPQPGQTDLDGQMRVWDGDDDGVARVDMGSDEFGSIVFGDYDCDDVVDLTDFAAWGACMTGPDSGPYAQGCQPFDFEFDTDVDLADFAAFQAVFGT